MRKQSIERIRRRIKDFFWITFKEFVYVSILTVLLLFSSFIGHARSMPRGTPGSGAYVSYYGFPFEWFKMQGNIYFNWFTYSSFEILWTGFAVDAILFVLFSLGIMHLANKMADYIPKDASYLRRTTMRR